MVLRLFVLLSRAEDRGQAPASTYRRYWTDFLVRIYWSSPIKTVTSYPREFYEAHLSTEPSQKGKDPRIPQTHEHYWWAQDNSCAAASGAQKAGSLAFVPT